MKPMKNQKNNTPAQLAAERAFEDILKCLEKKQSYIVQAGAGAGKTYSLNRTLESILSKNSSDYIKNGKKVACITFTNVAAENFMKNHTLYDKVLFTGTIHSFCWDLIKNFASEVRKAAISSGNYDKYLREDEDPSQYKVEYDLGVQGIEDGVISLHHDDIILFTTKLLENAKFQKIIESQFPIILVDEYQDSNTDLVKSILDNLVTNRTSIVFGFYGDHWQKIYGDGCGELIHKNLHEITQNSNFRSAQSIIRSLNAIRPDLHQEGEYPDNMGNIKVFTSNNWAGSWETKNHWQGSLPPEQINRNIDLVMTKLKNDGWDFEDSLKTRVLMLTHRSLASQQGYEAIISNYKYSDSYIKKQDPHIAFFIDILEPLRCAYEEGRYGVIFSLLGKKRPKITKHSDKKDWDDSVKALFEICDTGTVKEVIDHLTSFEILRLPNTLLKNEKKLNDELLIGNTDLDRKLKELKGLHSIPYSTVKNLEKFVSGFTPFQTQHGVKGDESENVLVVLGRGWNDYNYGNFLAISQTGTDDEKKTDSYIRTRNLFYVACSRAKQNLCLLFTQKLDDRSIKTLEDWFLGVIEHL